jgi:hypothetical protein
MNGFEMILPFLKPIEHLILDDTISEVMVNGSSHVFIEKDGFIQEIRGLSLGEKSLMIAVKNIARRLGDDISEAKPILDSRLPDGSRVAAVIPPCSLNGVTLTIRKFNSRHFGIDDLVEAGTLERWLANRLEDYVLAHKNILIAGGTGSGKTTLLNIGKVHPGGRTNPADRGHFRDSDGTAESGSIRGPAAAERTAGGNDPGSSESSPSPSARQNHPRRDTGGRGIRPLTTSEHRTLRQSFNRPRDLGQTSSGAIHELCAPEWCGTAVPRNQDQHRSLAERRRSTRTAARQAVCL